MSDVQERLKEQQAEEKRAARFDYEHTAFMLKKPYHDGIYRGPLRLKDKAAHRRLVEIAKQHGLYVWYAGIKYIEKDGRQVPHAVGCHLIDWDSIPDGPTAGDSGAAGAGSERQRGHPDDLKCRGCGQQCSSLSGFTLHSKTHGDGVHADPASALICDVCGKRCTSASGLTLHKKTHIRR